MNGGDLEKGGKENERGRERVQMRQEVREGEKEKKR